MRPIVSLFCSRMGYCTIVNELILDFEEMFVLFEAVTIFMFNIYDLHCRTQEAVEM